MAVKAPVKELKKELLSASEVAVALGVGTSRVHQLIKAGELPSIRVGSRQGGVRIPRQAFEEYVEDFNREARAKRLLKDIEKTVLLDCFIQAFDHVDFVALHQAFAQAIGKASETMGAPRRKPGDLDPLLLATLKEIDEAPSKAAQKLGAYLTGFAQNAHKE